MPRPWPFPPLGSLEHPGFLGSESWLPGFTYTACAVDSVGDRYDDVNPGVQQCNRKSATGPVTKHQTLTASPDSPSKSSARVGWHWAVAAAVIGAEPR